MELFMRNAREGVSSSKWPIRAEILIALGVVLLLPNPSFAQSHCAQVRQAVATYGYTAARRHALAHYGAKAVRTGDRCLARRHARRR
jgi:hypothetical protein